VASRARSGGAEPVAGPAGGARPVVARVRHAWRGLGAARAAEGALLGAGALFASQAALVASGGAPASVPAWTVAVLCALLAAASWWREHRLAPLDVARRVDRRRELAGALVTAYEVEQRGEISAVARALAAKVAARLSAREALRAVLPASAPLAAVPFLAGALLALALQARDDPRAASLEALAGRLNAQLAGAGAPAGAAKAAGLTAEEQRALIDLAHGAAALERAARSDELAAGEKEEDLAGRLRRLEADLEHLERRLPAGSELRRELERAAGTLDAALLALGEPRPAGPAADAGAAASGAGVDTGSGAELARAGSQGRMSGRAKPPEGDATQAADGEPHPETGVAGARWWPAEDEAIVARWVERCRALASEQR